MKARRRMKDNRVTDKNLASVRVPISFPPEIYRTLEEIAAEKKVSLARVVRAAAEQCITDKWRLLRKSQ